MMFNGKNIFNASFDVYAGNYHSVRPGYPGALFEDIKEQCKIDPEAKVLEIGAGSGIATIELAKLGCRIVAIEPGSNLAAIAKKQTEKLKNVEVFEGMFENFQSTDKFDAILAFTAFHWIDKGDKYRKTFDLIKDSGSLVLVWNSFFQSESQATSDVNKAYADFLPEVYPEESDINEVNKAVLDKLNGREQEIIQNSFFYPIFLRKYLITYNYDHITYPKLLNTFPKIVEIEEKKRLEFFDRISVVVKKHGKISVPVLTTLIVCRKRDFFLEMMAKSSEGG